MCTLSVSVCPLGHPGVPMSTPSRYTPRLYSSPGPPLNQSVSSSPFNLGLFLSLSPSPGTIATTATTGCDGRLNFETHDKTGEREEGSGDDEFMCNNSLGVLSAVALYHSELSGSETGKEEGWRQETAASVGDGVAQMRLESSSGKG